MKLTRAEAKKLGLDVPPKKPHKWNGSGQGKAVSYKGDQAFDALCAAHGLPKPQSEYVFSPSRKWRFDHLFEGWLALEVEGGVWDQGRHVRGQGFLDDIEKYNEAALLGYVVLRCTPQDVESGAAFALLKRALACHEEQP